jgi:acetyl-CoA synthetase
LAFKQPWPSLARTVWGAHQRYMDTYLNVYKGYYVSRNFVERSRYADYDSSLETVLDAITKATTGSEAVLTMLSMFLDTDCRLPKLRQRSLSIVSDLMTSFDATATKTKADSVAEAAVVGINDELTGQAVNAFVALKDGTESSDQVKKDLILQVRKSIGPFAAPKAIFVVPDLPKTRSGKIMRRIMRKILAGEEDQLGDTSTVSVFHPCGWRARIMVTRSGWVENCANASRSCRIPR